MSATGEMFTIDTNFIVASSSHESFEGIPSFQNTLTSFSLDHSALSTVSQLSTPSAKFTSQFFQTPEKKFINNFDQFGISPGSLEDGITLQLAEERIIADGILHLLDIDNENIMACILFLYAKQYFWKMPTYERISIIKQCLETENENFDRLLSIARSDASDKIRSDDDAFKRYFNMAETSRRYFSSSGTVGGFPRTPFARFQASRNCYIVSACTWYTLMLQKQFPDADNADHPIDVGYCARHWIVPDDEALINRVIGNLGGCANGLAYNLTTKRNPAVWMFINFESELKLSESSVLFWRNSVFECLKRFGFGLVTRFCVNEAFRTVSSTMTTNYLGYWKFDGDASCTGEFVKMDRDDNYNSQYEEMQKKWDAINGKSSKKRRHDDLFAGSSLASRALFNESSPVETKDEQYVKSNHSSTLYFNGIDVARSPTHSMVLLGAHEEEGKPYFMLLNWWKHMPLIMVSADYLEACKCRVAFLTDTLTQDSTLPRKPGLYGDSCYGDVGEDGEDSEDGMELSFDDEYVETKDGF